jgi:hypothetical protein
LSHEYGHYVVSTYGDVSDTCVAGTDEGDPLDEALATSFAALLWRDSYLTKARLGAFQTFTNMPNLAHFSAGSLSSVPIGCAPGTLHSAGVLFIQSIVELSYNRNCLANSCSTASLFNTDAATAVWTGLSEDTALLRLGRALGFAMSVLPTNGITFTSVRAQMRSRISTDADVATATRAQRVFSHHGLTCPTCCAGC